MFELLLFAIAAGALVLLAIYGEMRQRNRSLLAVLGIQNRNRSTRRAGSSTAETRSQPPSRATQQTLVRLLRGDRRAAERLVNNIQSRHPEKSERWCWEKAIYDVERDRRRG